MMNIKLVGVLCILLTASMFWNLWQKNTITRLESELHLCRLSERNLTETVKTQNEAIEKMRTEVKLVEKRDLNHIVIKDKSCEAQLNAYKSLFEEFNK